MKAFILCAGQGARLRPFTHGLPKAAMPFLNLPLLSLGWFCLERMGMSEAILNSCLFPEKLAETVDFLKTPKQKTKILFEPESLGSAGGLYNALKQSPPCFQEEEDFFYLNGDSLFFPSSINRLTEFLKDFKKRDLEGAFFGAPLQPDETQPGGSVSGCLWMDRDFLLRGVGSAEKMSSSGFSPLSFSPPDGAPLRTPGSSKNSSGKDPRRFFSALAGNLKRGELLPVKFSGLALLRGRFLKRLSPKTSHIFHDVIAPLLKERLFRVFADEGGMVLEGGEKPGYLKAAKIAIEALFSETKNEDSPNLKFFLESLFWRFDPDDHLAGLQSGRKWARRVKAPLLAPSSAQGLERLKAEGFCVIGPGASFTGDSFLKESVLGPNLRWRGALHREIAIKFSP